MEFVYAFDLATLILIIILALIGFIGNIVVVIVYLSTANRSYTNYFFVNLSIADILFTLNSLPILINDSLFYINIGEFGEWHLGPYFCSAGLYFENLLIAVSSLSLVLIGIERFIAIKKPFFVHKYVSGSTSVIVLLLAWLFAIIFSSPFLFFLEYNASNGANETIELNNNETNVTLTSLSSWCGLTSNSDESKIYFLIFVSFFIFVPTLLLTFSYLFIIRNMSNVQNEHTSKIDKKYKHSRQSSTSHLVGANHINIHYKIPASKVKLTLKPRNSFELYSDLKVEKKFYGTVSPKLFEIRQSVAKPLIDLSNGNSTLNHNLNIKKRQTISVCFVSLLFFFCVIPIKLFQILKFLINIDNLEITHTVFLISKLLFYTHMMSNPIVYNLMSTKFNRSFKNVLLCKKFRCTKK